MIICEEFSDFTYYVRFANGREYYPTWKSWRRLHHCLTYQGLRTLSGCRAGVRFVHYYA